MCYYGQVSFYIPMYIQLLLLSDGTRVFVLLRGGETVVGVDRDLLCVTCAYRLIVRRRAFTLALH